VNVTLVNELDVPLGIDTLNELAAAVMVAEGLAPDTEVAIHLVGVDRIADLNQQHLGKAGPTDVLSFPIEDLVPGAVAAASDGGPPTNIGDVVICPAVVQANAEAAGVEYVDEMALMVVHGVLHLLGYDHVDDADAEQMEGRERELLGAAGRVRP